MALQRKYSPDVAAAAFEKKKAANERAHLRKLEKIKSPEYQKAQREKAEAKREKRLELIRTPEYQQAQRDKQSATAEKKRARLSLVDKTEDPKPKKRKGGPGLVGDRAPTAEERRYMAAISKLTCIACLQHGKESPVISLHHVDGRSKPDAHKKVLPLCDHHHQHAAPAPVRAQFPWLVPVHADGSCGGKAEFERQNGKIEKLLDEVYRLAGLIH